MEMKLSEKKVLILAFVGIGIFFVLIVIAMFFYPGGIRDNLSIQGYSFWGNTFSDLGRTIAWNGDSNLISMILFTFAFGVQIISIIPFYVKFMQVFQEIELERKVSKIGSYFGIISSIAFIGVLCTPADILNGPHWIFVFIAYPSVFIMGFSYSVVLFINDKFTRTFALIYTILHLIFFLSLLIGLVGISFSRTIMVIGQKILTFSLLIDFLLLIYGTWKLKNDRVTESA
jgi:hypothetical protein